MIYDIYFLILSIKNSRSGAIIILTGLSIFIVTGVNDILYFNGLSSLGNVVPYGLFIFVFSQAYALSRYIQKLL